MKTCLAVAAMVVLSGCGGEDDASSQAADLNSSVPILSPPIEHFKYGSIGADKLGLPLVLFKAIPLVCADLLPEGADPRNKPLEAYGLIYEDGHELPIGFSKRRVLGIDLIGNNCSVCHTSTVRETESSPRTTYFGAPATRFDIERYQQFLFDCISDKSRFNSQNLNSAFNELGIWGLERYLAFKSTLIRAFLEDTATKVGSVVRDGPWGPGRDDAIGLSGAILLGEEFVPTIAAPVDFPSVWNQKAREGHALHWDGAAGSARERNILVAVGAGTPANSVPIKSLDAVQSWLDGLAPPEYPFPIDADLADQGAEIFAARCNDCHGASGARTFEVTSLAEIGTDANRVDSVTDEAVAELNSLSGSGWHFEEFAKTDGYVNNLLDGIWLRAPYLHNGSVPTLRDLLSPPASRPKEFYRGNDVYDQENVGFVSTVASEGAVQYSSYDTSRQGNDNGGHFGPEYGTDLSDEEIDALLEYMKTL
jgi:mono/diheme cytochrome c family protein